MGTGRQRQCSGWHGTCRTSQGEDHVTFATVQGMASFTLILQTTKEVAVLCIGITLSSSAAAGLQVRTRNRKLVEKITSGTVTEGSGALPTRLYQRLLDAAVMQCKHAITCTFVFVFTNNHDLIQTQYFLFRFIQ